MVWIFVWSFIVLVAGHNHTTYSPISHCGAFTKQSFTLKCFRGFAKNFFFKKSKIAMEVGGWWVQVSLGILLLLENRPKIALNQY